jgi:hypothetical protein
LREALDIEWLCKPSGDSGQTPTPCFPPPESLDKWGPEFNVESMNELVFFCCGDKASIGEKDFINSQSNE